jgi:hypothetical protein
MPRMTKKKYAVAAGVGAAALTVSAAFAYWTSTGEDTATATTGNENAWTVQIDDSSISNGALTPDGPTDNVLFTVTNNETGTKQIEAGQLSVTVDSVSPATCAAADFAITNATVPTGVNVAGGGGSVNGSFDVQLTNTNVNQNDCKGATVTYKVAIS